MLYNVLCFFGALTLISLVYCIALSLLYTGFTPEETVGIWFTAGLYAFLSFLRFLFWVVADF